MENLTNKNLVYKGNKKDIWCLTHTGKIIEHQLEKSRLDGQPYKVTRNKSNL